MPIDNIAFFGDSYCADREDTYIEQLSKDYGILHLGEHGHGLNFANEQFRTFLDGFTDFENVFFIFMNSASIRKQINFPSGERPLPFSTDEGGMEDFDRSFSRAIEYHELYIQNDNEDARNYINALEAQQWLLHNYNIKKYKRFFCFRHEAETYNPLSFSYDNIPFSNLIDFSRHFGDYAGEHVDYKNHFSPKGQIGMAQVIREAIKDYESSN